MRPEGSFIQGLRTYLATLSQTLSDPLLRAWYRKALIRTLIVALSIFFLILSLGSFFLYEFLSTWTPFGLSEGWMAGLGIVLWVLLAFYLSGTITAAVLNGLVMLLSGERSLLRAIGFPKQSLHKAPFVYMKREYLSIALGALVSLCFWPLLLFPLTMPIGFAIFAWVMGRDALIVGRRMQYEARGLDAMPEKRKVSTSMHVGLGIIPSVCAFFPIVGWATLPLIQLAGLNYFLKTQKSV